MYHVFGYTDDCRDFYYYFNSFVEAVKVYNELKYHSVVFMTRGNNPYTCRYLN